MDDDGAALRDALRDANLAAELTERLAVEAGKAVALAHVRTAESLDIARLADKAAVAAGRAADRARSVANEAAGRARHLRDHEGKADDAVAEMRARQVDATDADDRRNERPEAGSQRDAS